MNAAAWVCACMCPLENGSAVAAKAARQKHTLSVWSGLVTTDDRGRSNVVPVLFGKIIENSAYCLHAAAAAAAATTTVGFHVCELCFLRIIPISGLWAFVLTQVDKWRRSWMSEPGRLLTMHDLSTFCVGLIPGDLNVCTSWF